MIVQQFFFKTAIFRVIYSEIQACIIIKEEVVSTGIWLEISAMRFDDY